MKVKYVIDGKDYVTLPAYEILEDKYNQLEEENKKLKSDLAFERTMLDNVRAEYESLQNVNKNLKEKVETLELWLDNKEKLNEEYRKQIDKLRTDNIYEEWLYD